MLLWVKEEIRPIWISLHISELKELSQTKNQNLLTDLIEEIIIEEKISSVPSKQLNKGLISFYLMGDYGLTEHFVGWFR